MSTYAAFLGRDVLTIAGGFILPPYVSKAMQSATGWEKKHADKLAQLTTPMAMQLVCTPLHLVALNFYNTPVATVGERISQVWATCPQSTFTRMIRQLCAYGVGGVGNKSLIAYGRAWSENKYCRPH